VQIDLKMKIGGIANLGSIAGNLASISIDLYSLMLPLYRHAGIHISRGMRRYTFSAML
jgi:hypothetical protein